MGRLYLQDGSIAERTAELVTLSYNLLCFTHDYLYGQAGYYGFADDGTGYAEATTVAAVDKLGLDALFLQYDSETRDLLLSSSYMDYIKGLGRLVYYTYGDLHAALHTYNYKPSFTQAQKDELNSYMTEIQSEKQNKFNSKAESPQSTRITKGKADSEGLTVPIEVLSDGKTAVIRFDEFEFDVAGWKAYYAQENLAANPDPETVDIPEDTMGFFYKSFYTILNDNDYKDVKNVIVDLSCNYGGVTITCQKALCYLLGNVDIRQYDVHTGTMYNSHNTLADLNLDGKIDASNTTFSNVCYANGIPIIAKESAAEVMSL